jgi:hypothetical protein
MMQQPIIKLLHPLIDSADAGVAGGAGCTAHDPSITSSSIFSPPSLLEFVEHPTSVLFEVPSNYSKAFFHPRF